MRKRPNNTQVLAIVLFVLACVIGMLSQKQSQPDMKIPRARYTDATPLGGKGLRLLLERLNYQTRVENQVVKAIPENARVWLLLDPLTYFSLRESKLLLQWVENGGTLIWSATSMESAQNDREREEEHQSTGIQHLRAQLDINHVGADRNLYGRSSEPLPPLANLQQHAVSEVWSGVKKAQASAGFLEVGRPHLPLARISSNTQLAQIPYGKGRVFVVPDALLFTNYALSKPDNAVLLSNLIRLHASEKSLVIFDERQHGETEEKFEENWLYYLMQPPLRYAVIQIFVAALLVALLYGRRLGTPVPLPDAGPVTRASQWAQAMGALFQKVGRPRAAGEILAEDFRRQLARRLGLSINDSDALIAARASEAGGGSARAIEHLLQRIRTSSDNEAQVLHDSQEMDKILRSLDQR